MILEVVKIAELAGDEILRRYAKSDIQIQTKEDNTPVTEADFAAHEIIEPGLLTLNSKTPVISEEGDIPEYAKRQDWKSFWLVDPLDGTKEFIRRSGEFTVNIALIENGIPILGVIHIPDQGLTYYASKEAGTFKRDLRAESETQIYSTDPSVGDPLTIVSSRSHPAKIPDSLRSQLNIASEIHSGSALKMCVLAEGRADLYPRFSPSMEWDVAAGDALYRYSSRGGAVKPSPFRYNTKSLRIKSFVLGIEKFNEAVEAI